MAKNVYEGLYIFDTGRFSRDSEEVANNVQTMVEETGGEILVSRLWEERRLAYPIRGQKKGVYWLTYFRLEGSQIGALERKCQLSDPILRVLFTRIDARIVDTLVEHAKSGPVVRPVETPEISPAENRRERIARAVEGVEAEPTFE